MTIISTYFCYKRTSPPPNGRTPYFIQMRLESMQWLLHSSNLAFDVSYVVKIIKRNISIEVVYLTLEKIEIKYCKAFLNKIYWKRVFSLVHTTRKVTQSDLGTTWLELTYVGFCNVDANLPRLKSGRFTPTLQKSYKTICELIQKAACFGWVAKRPSQFH